MGDVCVIGAGYVGLVTGVGLAELGHSVTCLEVDEHRLRVLRSGNTFFHEHGLPGLIAKNTQAGRLSFTDSYRDAIPKAEFIFIAVNTPMGEHGQADTSYVFAAVNSILTHTQGRHIIVTKSTVPVGTGDRIATMIAEAGLMESIAVVSNPEFLREGAAVRDFLSPDRIVVGSDTPTAAALVAGLYESLAAPTVICSLRSAELAKYAANALLATRISFMNEISAICEVVDADVQDISRIVGFDRRIGGTYLNAGLGWGGSCFPKDVRALAATAAAHGVQPSMLEATFEVNRQQRDRVYGRLLNGLRLNNGHVPTVAVLGLSFKPGTDDVRESPAIDIILRLLDAGVRVQAHDPIAIESARRVVSDVKYCDDAYAALCGSDAVLIATEWSDYQQLDWQRVHALMRGQTIVDGRNLLDGQLMQSLGFRYESVGRKPLPADDTTFIGVSAAAGGS
jgi:UDPglucose 6-dehydrogenase